MSISSSFCALASRLFRRHRLADELEEELSSHIQHRADELHIARLISHGMGHDVNMFDPLIRHP